MGYILEILNISWRLCLAAIGLSFIGSEINDFFILKKENDWFVFILFIAFSVLMMVPFIRYAKRKIEEWKFEQRDASYAALFKSKTMEYAGILKTDVLGIGRVIKHDFNEQERLISQFREDYNEFFSEQGKGVRENMRIQNTATQLYWNTLSLQKKRLDKKGMTMSLQASRMLYKKGEPAVTGGAVFDGKYEISYITEMINAVRSFFINGRRTAHFKSKEVARYRLLDTQKNEKGMIVCPNCGGLSTRENLIDGCDFCGTRFTVEDLGMRVSDFGLYPDASVEYKKYKDRRSRYALIVGLLSAIPCLIYMIMDTFDVLTAHPLSDDGVISDFGLMIVITVIMTWIVVSFAEGVFLVTLFPLMQAKASLTYFGRKALHALQKSETHNKNAEENIRKYDSLFSLGGFYSDVQNKLAVLHYADNCRQMEAFGEGRRALEAFAELPKQYEDVVNMDVSSMILNDYVIEDELQKMDVTANLILLEAKDQKVRKRSERVRIKLIKDKNCLTQSVSGPEIMICKKCGASISLMDGSICSQCGNVRHLSAYDWAIEEFEIQ